MFCQSCGNKMDEGVRFCQKCGAQISAAEAVKNTETKANYGSIAENPGKNKLILMAAIVAIGIGFAFLIAAIVLNFVIPGMQGKQVTQEKTIAPILGPLIFLAASAIPIVLSFLGWKKKKRAMVLIAGILCISLFMFIPSGIMYIVAFSKMKKPV